MLFELSAVGGPLARRLARRRADTDSFPWSELEQMRGTEAGDSARIAWTQSAFSEYASAASFGEITVGLLAAGAPIDLIAAAGDFVVDEIVHAELSARMAMGLGGAVPLDVDLERLVRPPTAQGSLLRVAELVVRTCCVGEALTVGMLTASREAATERIVADVIGRIVRDEAEHAELGWTFLDWADDALDDAARAHLGRVASGAVASFAPLFSRGCVGAFSCEAYDAAFAKTLERRVVAPLRERGVFVDPTPIRSILDAPAP